MTYMNSPDTWANQGRFRCKPLNRLDQGLRRPPPPALRQENAEARRD